MPTVSNSHVPRFAEHFDRACKFRYKDSTGLLPDQMEILSKAEDLNVAFIAAFGNLVKDGFINAGYRQINAALGVNPIRCIMVGNKEIRWPEVQDFVKNGYLLHPQYGVVTREVFKKLIDDIGLHLIISATPTMVHVEDALMAMEKKKDMLIEKPGFRISHASSERKTMLEAVRSGKVNLIDFFYYSDAVMEFYMNLDHYLEGLGAIKSVKATCLEPHSVLTEGDGTRWKMLMNEEINGGTLGADQLPHPLVLMHGFLQYKFGIGVDQANFDRVYRAMDLDVVDKAMAERVKLPELAETTMLIGGTITPRGQSEILLEAACGKGFHVAGSKKGIPMPTYVLEITCEDGTVKVGLGDLQQGSKPYIAVIPNDKSRPVRVLMMRNGGNGYKLCIADGISHALQTANPTDLAQPIAQRVANQTKAAFASLDVLTGLREMLLRDSDRAKVHFYRGEEPIEVPREFSPPNVDAWIPYKPPKVSSLQK